MDTYVSVDSADGVELLNSGQPSLEAGSGSKTAGSLFKSKRGVMRLLTCLGSVAIFATLSIAALAQDELDCITTDPAHHQVVFENAQVRVVRWVVPPGDKTLYHSHPNNLNILLTDYTARVTTPDGKTTDVYLTAGSVTWREPGAHTVENQGSQPMIGILIEPRKPASVRPAGSADPVVVDPQHQRVEFENDRIRVIRERQPAQFPMHGHPDNVQVLLTDLNARLTTSDGESQLATGHAGEVRWRTASQHVGQNLSDEPFEQIVVEMKGSSRAAPGDK